MKKEFKDRRLTGRTEQVCVGLRRDSFDMLCDITDDYHIELPRSCTFMSMAELFRIDENRIYIPGGKLLDKPKGDDGKADTVWTNIQMTPKHKAMVQELAKLTDTSAGHVADCIIHQFVEKMR